jgi:hypothetical protein
MRNGRRSIGFLAGACGGEGEVRAFFFPGADAGLHEGDFEAGGIVVRDELRLFESVNESLATAREIVDVEQPAGAAVNAEMSARAACCFTRW